MTTWRYRLEQAYRYVSHWLLGVEYRNEWIEISDGSIMIHRGYAWDGCSPALRLPGGLWLGTPDGPLMPDGRPQAFYASLVHDALCQWAAEIPIRQEDTVALFRDMLCEAGFPPWRLRLYAGAVDRLGPQRFGGDELLPATR